MRHPLAIALLALTTACGGKSKPDPEETADVGPAIAKLLVGGEHSCVWLKPQLRCWGANDHGQLLTGDIVERAGPVVASEADGALSVALGLHATAWVAPDGKSLEWRGHIEAVDEGVSERKTISGRVADVFGGPTADYFCYRDSEDDHACWGFNNYGQFEGGLVVEHSPTGDEALRGALELVLGKAQLCARFADRVECRGLSDADMPERMNWTKPFGLFAVESLSAGSFHRCAVVDGSPRCWGTNKDGELGVAGDSMPTPQTVPLEARSVAAGGAHSCAILRTNEVACWGANDAGQSGGPSLSAPVSPPAKIPGLVDVVQIALGVSHSCAMTLGGDVWCWGDNHHHQLGVAGVESTSVPVKVDFSKL